MALQAHNPNGATTTNTQKVTRVKGYKADGTLLDSGALNITIGPNKTVDYLIPGYSTYTATSYAVELSWTQTNDLARSPILQGWMLLEDTTGKLLSAVPVKCQ